MMESIKKFDRKNMQNELKNNYQEALKDETFKKLVNDLKLDNKTASLNTTMLLDSCMELKNCHNCKGIYECQNKVLGHYLYPRATGNILELVYVPCKYQKEQDRLMELRNNSTKELQNARFKDIDMSDKKRILFNPFN